ncbi:MAG TPA: hypothetical protein VEQ11_13755 [Chloroflexota bacterium]|nr:hypothetical protein [Chloroflexota bacterium]
MTLDWVAPLPDFSRPSVSARIRIGPHAFRLLVSEVNPHPPGELDTDLVQLTVVLKGRPLTLHDLGAATARCSMLWTYLCTRLTELTVDFYDPRPRPDGALNPRLGCWGTRPDLRAAGREDDCTLAVVAGISIWRPGSRPRGSAHDYARELGETLAEVLAYWVLTVERDKRA